MFTLPDSIKSDEKQYSSIVWNTEQELYEWTETQKFYTTEEKLDAYKTEQLNLKAAEQAHDTNLVIATIDEELDWIDAGEATK